jgi:hypothetical protein
MAGAPPHLSYSDELILRAIREGRRDPEIAVALGVTTGIAKQRIERLIRLSGATDRSGLATWDPLATPLEVVEAPVEAEAEAEMPGARRSIPAWRLAGLAAAVVLAVGGFFTWSRWADEEGVAVPAAPSAEATVAARMPVVSGGIPVERLRFVPAGEYPDDLLLYVLRGCEGCAAPIALDRIYRDQFGVLQTEVIFRPDSSTGRHILSVWAQRDASDIIIAVCDTGSCGATGPVVEGTSTRFYRSLDGGANFVDIGAVDGVASTVSASYGGPLVIVKSDSEGLVAYTVLGSDEYVDPSPLLPQAPPAEFALISKLGPDDVQGLARVTTSAGGVFAYTTFPYSPSPDEDGVVTRLGIADRFGYTARLLEYVGAPLTLGAWLDSDTVTGTVAMPPGVVLSGDLAGVRKQYTPVLIDVVRATVTALPEPFLNVRYASATNTVVAAVPGPFWRVEAADGACMPLFSFPRMDAQQVACASAGTLVTFVETRMVVSEEWQGVRLPSGKTGWVRPADLGLLGQ